MKGIGQNDDEIGLQDILAPMELNFEDELNQQEQQQARIHVCRQNCHQRYVARNLHQGRTTPSQQIHEQHHIEQLPKAPHAKPCIAAQVDTLLIVPNGTSRQASFPESIERGK
ncbi:hypothetical protein COLO4_05319 [Corchorus olitorius]|uniref:Uncharacterized protein n=1 Tax=Corchorus olitorius TaxID=93759 RepID=A0A1R3KRA4_9ROSI|nr:hypothetical protein COLO4_05319 [Corchorus olitorius]